MTPYEVKSRFTAWWARKGPFDRRVYAGLSVLLAAGSWYALVWAPLDDARRSAKSEILRLDGATLILARLPGEAVAPTPAPGSLQSVIAELAATQGLEIAAVRGSDSGLVVSFETAPFDRLARWLENLSKQAGVRVESARIERRAEPGTVSAEIELSP